VGKGFYILGEGHAACLGFEPRAFRQFSGLRTSGCRGFRFEVSKKLQFQKGSQLLLER